MLFCRRDYKNTFALIIYNIDITKTKFWPALHAFSLLLFVMFEVFQKYDQSNSYKNGRKNKEIIKNKKNIIYNILNIEKKISSYRKTYSVVELLEGRAIS